MRYDYAQFAIELGRRVKSLRKDRGLTQRDLVVSYGFHLTHLQRIERGKGVSIPTLLRLAEVFQISFEDLVAGLGIVKKDGA